MQRIASLFILICLGNIAWANWRCPAIDAQGHFYQVPHHYLKMAVHRSLDKCKKQSTSPASCLVERAFCQRTVENLQDGHYWQCYAYDSKALSYPSGPYNSKYQAAFAAENICKRLSHDPASCYFRLFTCETV